MTLLDPGDVQRRTVTALRALEALRAGVPNRESVLHLGTMQAQVVDKYLANLELTARRANWEPTDRASAGLLISGGFGSGKSHLLEYLAQRALQQNFVVSRVVISKETPLYNLAAVYRAAINDARVPGRPGSAITEIATGLQTDSLRFAQLYRWLATDGSFVDHRLTSTLRMFEQFAGGDEEFVDKILQFWAGDQFAVAEIRRRLREAGWLSEYNIRSTREDVLCRDRLSFVSRLIGAAGYSGWVILLDEVELIGRYSLLQRGRAYAELAQWLQGASHDPQAPVTTVLTTVDDFESEVLVARNDLEKIPVRLAAMAQGSPQLLELAKRGMELLRDNQIRLEPPTNEELDVTYRAIKALHGEALQWDPPDVHGIERLPSNRMRQYVRSWINEWDLIYLDPSYTPFTLSTDVKVDLRESIQAEDEPTSPW
ncbi:MAG: ATP-binding protein [Gammaproteobacteria bacterium]|uniref:BREX system ATP-binding domain-containing protein n=1 Tax=Ferrimicrobium acidiphilum TaxID=121039 RepID=UPI0023F39909|nr:BREX system ATP-binding domain-containing protein [Ferrimicrobium acidiphilum]MCL5052788.1 ATP-binding protein [Gammaproteobacteria bacterium]